MLAFNSHETPILSLEGLGHHEDREHRRGVEHGTAVDVGLVVEHRREVAGHLAEDVLADDGEDNAGRTYVLLCAAVEEML